MPTDPRMERLAILTTAANRSLSLFSQQIRLLPTSSKERHGTKRDTFEHEFGLSNPGRTARSNEGMQDWEAFLRDERRMRALTKEIKRLMMEDKRRGLDV